MVIDCIIEQVSKIQGRGCEFKIIHRLLQVSFSPFHIPVYRQGSCMSRWFLMALYCLHDRDYETDWDRLIPLVSPPFAKGSIGLLVETLFWCWCFAKCIVDISPENEEVLHCGYCIKHSWNGVIYTVYMHVQSKAWTFPPWVPSQEHIAFLHLSNSLIKYAHTRWKIFVLSVICIGVPNMNGFWYWWSYR